MDASIESFVYYLRYERNYSDYTINAYSSDLHQFEKYVRDEVGSFIPIQIDLDVARGWLVFLLKQKKSPVSVKRKLSSLKSYFKFLVKKGDILANPLRLAVGPKTGKSLNP